MRIHPLNKVVFIQKVAAFIKTDSANDLFARAYVNNSWNDTIKNYAFHIFEERARAVKNTRILEQVCDSVIKSGVLWFVDVLMSSKTVLDRVNFPILVCKNKTSTLAIMQFVVQKIVEVGGTGLLKSQLIATSAFGWGCLKFSCCGSSPEIMNFLFEKIVEVGGRDVLKSELIATDNLDKSCLMCACCSSSPEVTKIVFDKIVEVGGRTLLENQFMATDCTGLNCLMFAVRFSSSPEVVKLVLEQIVEVGGKDLLKREVAATSSLGATCLMLGCRNSDAPEVVKFFAVVLFELGIFQEQYAKLDVDEKEKLRENTHDIEDASWVPDPEIVAEVREILQRSKTDDKKKTNTGCECVLQ